MGTITGLDCFQLQNFVSYLAWTAASGHYKPQEKLDLIKQVQSLRVCTLAYQHYKNVFSFTMSLHLSFH